MPTEEVELAAGNDSATETPSPLGPVVTAPQKSEGAVSAAANAACSTPEAKKLINVLSELHFNKLNIEAGLKDRSASLVKENLDAFASSPHDLGHTNLVVHRILTRDDPPFRH